MAKKPTGRPSSFTQEVADAICERIAGGESLRGICQEEAMPSAGTVCRWLADDDRAEFRKQYARAREAQADVLFDEILAISDEEATMVRRPKGAPGKEEDDQEVEVVFDAVAVARNRLRVDARKWMAGKLRPKVYGDKLEVAGPGPNGEHAAKVSVEFVTSPNS